MASKVFILSPARLDGVRAQYLFEGSGELARRLRAREGAPIGEVFTYLSSLYFRGKLAYASKFAIPPPDNDWLASGALVITQNRGLIDVKTRVCVEHLEAFAETDIHHQERAFRRPLERDAASLGQVIGSEGRVVLLGSVASKKYVEPLLAALGERLLFPSDFVGRGDMSRGGLLLRATDDNRELAYAPVLGAARHGVRPPKLSPRK